MTATLEQIRAVLDRIVDDATGVALGHAVRDRDIDLGGSVPAIRAEVGYPLPEERRGALLGQALAAFSEAGLGEVAIDLQWKVQSHAVQRTLKPVPGIRNIIAVSSGKGGVGKSTTAVNLALALARDGASVGMLDADVYGPSLPIMTGATGRPPSHDGKTMEPLEAHGIKVNSIGFLMGDDAPAIWRGPMATQALEQLLQLTNWGDLDYLIIDMPPGTGDIALTLSQKVPVVGAVIVTTPQDIALMDARRGLMMFNKVDVPILGIVENMAVHVCSNCGHAEHIFGEGGGQRMAQQYDTPWLGSLPLSMPIRVQADSGRPTVVADPGSAEALAYQQIARRVEGRVAVLPRDMSARFPSVVVESL